MATCYIPINRHARVTLANGLPAYTRDRRVTQADLEQFGSREKALAARGMGL